MATSLLSPSTTVKRWMFIKLQDYVSNESINFVPIPENNSISLHFNFRYKQVALNSLDNGSWGGEVYIWDIHDLPNPSVIYFSFEVANGWKIEYAVNGVPKVVTFPNRLGITSIDNINNNYVSNFGSTAIITGPLNNAILRSTDYGNTFSEVPVTALSGYAYWRAIAVTNSAATQTAVAYGGAIYRSFDYGATWSNAGLTIDGSANANTVTPRNWQDIAISAETGAIQVSCVSNGLLYVSSNTGATWVSSSIVIDGSGTQTTNRMWQAVAVSANGQYALACVNSSSDSGYLYRSTNSGVSWVSSTINIDGQPTQTTNQLWQDVAMSANGKYQVACVGSSGYIYYSKNYGETWFSLVAGGSRAWSSVSVSENGSTISATTNDSTGGVWVYTMPQEQYNHPTMVMNAGGGAPTTTPATVRAIAYGNSGTGAMVDGYWVAGADASANTLAYSSNGIDWTAVIGSKTSLFNSVNGVAYGADIFGTPLWVAVGLPFVGSLPGVSAYSIAYSYNMMTWTGVMNTLNFTGQGNHVAYGEDEFGAGIWVAVGQGDGVLSENLGNSSFGNDRSIGGTIFYSYDGANWVAATGAGVFAVSGTDVSWGVDASGVALWVATGIGYTHPQTGAFLPGGQVAHSINGKVWTPIRAPVAISPALTPTTLTTRGGVMVRPPTSTGVVPSTIGNTWRMLGGDIDGEAPNDNSGYSVSVSADGQIVAIASSGNDANGINSGQVRVYRYNPNKTVAQMKQNLPGFGPVGWDRLGEDIDGEGVYQQSLYPRRGVSLSSDGTTVAIGTDANNGNGYYSGSVRVYKYTPNKTIGVSNQYDPLFGPVGWTRMGADIDGEAVSNSSGWSVSISADGTIVAIGALNNSDAGASAGHVRVYKYTPSKTVAVTNQTDASFGPIGWTRLGADIDGETADSTSGVSVELSADGTTVAIGAHRNNNLQGHVRVYKYSASKTSAQMNQTLPNFGPIGWNRVGEDIDGVEPLYINDGPITIPTLDITSFPVLNTIQRWNIDISFTVTGGLGTWRALVGNMYYNSTSERGWGIWVSSQDGIHFEHNTASARFNAFSSNVALNVPYTLKVMKDETNTTLQLFNVSTQTMLTHTAATLTDPLGIGPVSIGGWKQVTNENFPGTISYVRVYSHSLSISGVSVSLSADGSIVAIGGTNNDDVGLDKGYVRVFKNNPSKVSPNLIGPAGWDRVGGNIYGENNFDYSGSGIQLSADGMTIAIGATGNDSALTGYQQNGHVRVYKYNPTKALGITDQSLPNFGPAGWDRIGMDLDGKAADDYSGYGVSLSSDGTTVVIGSVWNDNGGNQSGNTRVYKLDMYGALTYTSSDPSVADIYGNTVLLIKDGASGTTTITATQDAVSPFTVAPTTIQGTLTVSGTTYTLVYDTIYPIYTPFTDASSGDTITVAYGRAGAQGSGAPLWMVGGSGGTNVFAMSNSPMRHGSWSVVGSGAANAPFSICNSLGYSNGVWVAGNNTNQTNLLARSVDGGATWTPVSASSLSSILTGAASMGANSFCNYSLAYADVSNDTNLRSWVAVQGTKNFFFDGGVSAVATISSDVSAVGYSLGGGRAWWVAGGVGLSGVASIGYTTDPNGATGWTKSNSVGISNLARINAIAFSSLNLQWLAVGVGSTGSPGTNILYSDALGVDWTATAVASGSSPDITLNACIWNPVSQRWITAGTRNGGVGANAACIYISTDVSGSATPWTPVVGTGAILSQVYSLAYNGTVWIAAGVPASDNGSTSTLMRTADPSGATGWHGITGTNGSTGGFDTATRSIAWNSDEQMWVATGENTGSVADASFSSIIYSRDINGAAGTWRSVRESNSFCFSGEGRGITFTGEKWFAVGDTSSGSGIVATTGVNVAASSNASTASWNSVSHGTAMTRTNDIAYTGRRLVVTGSGQTTLSGIIYSNDGNGGPGTWNLLPTTSAGAFNDTVEGGTSLTFEPSYEGSSRLIATGQSATNVLSLSTDNGETWVSPSVQYSSTNTFDTTTKSLFTNSGNSVAYVGNDTLFAGGGNDVHWTGKRWVATGRTSNAGGTGVSASTPKTLSTETPILIHNNTSSVATSPDGIMWQSVRASQAPNLSEGICIGANSRIGATPLINSQIVINDFGDTEGNTEYGGSGTGIAQIDIIAEVTPVSNVALNAVQTVGIIGAAGNSGTNGVGHLPIPSFDTTAFTITTRPM